MNPEPITDAPPIPGMQDSALLAAIVDSSDDAIISKNLNGVITSWNKAAERIFGYSPGEAIGQSVTLLIPPHRIDEESRILEKVARGERIEHFETQRLRKDGMCLDISLTISPVKGENGEIIGASKIARDITERRRSERELQQSERLLTDFFENATIGLHWVGPDGIILRANQAELAMLGYSKEEYIGRHITDFHVDPPVIEHILQRLSAGETVNDCEARLRCKDGSIKHVVISSSGLWEKGEFVHTRCFTRDITNQKVAEAKVAETIRELNDLKTALDQHAIVAVTDARGKILYANEKFCAISKYPLEELIGQDHRIINSGYHSKEFIRDIWETIRSGRVWKGEIKNRAKDGSHYWVDTTIVPYLDDSGKPVQFIAIRADITDRKLAEEKLRESELRFRTMADAAPVLIWMAGRDKLCYYFNKSWLDFTGRTLEEESGNGWAEGVHPDDYARCLNIYMSSFDARKEFEIEYRLRNHKGDYRWILDRGVPRFGPDGTFQGYIGGCVDIENQKHAEEKLERQVAERTVHLKETVNSLESLCYTIAHDLRAPLRAINGLTNILVEDYAPAFDEDGKALAKRIASGASRMDTLIHDLLEYARLSHAEHPESDQDLNHLVNTILKGMAAEVSARNAEIIVHPLPVIRGQAVLLKQVFSNLLHNALKFTEPDETPRIEIGYKNTGKHIRCWVQDNGIGIREDYHERVFDVFQRLHPNDTRYPGTGVGLAIVKKGMERMGGRVSIVSNATPGTRFILDFPATRRA